MKVGLYGFGEVGYHLALHRARSVPCLAYNHGTRNFPPYERTFRDRAAQADVRLVESVDSLVDECDLIVVATLSAAVSEVADTLSAASLDRTRHLVLDLTNAPPSRKRDASARLPDACYVDGALLEPPILAGRDAITIVSGERAEECRQLAGVVLADCTVIGDQVGMAAAYKSILQILSKGYQALQWEAVLGAVATGLDVEVLRRLRLRAGAEAELAFGVDDYLLAHSAKHATRMSDDLRGSIASLTELGMRCPAAEGAVVGLEHVAALGLDATFGDDGGLRHDELRERLLALPATASTHRTGTKESAS
ncbi:hypothetical protein [Actinophytocola sp.]|uniref:hypothetical protein n=1 Tax=Actinophytocola sp. TaxID=1872138 RepID=UPI003D6C646F